VLPEIPWTATDGTTFRDLQARAGAILARLESKIADTLQDPVALAMLTAHVAELNTALRDVASSDLAVNALINLGRALERGHTRRPPLHLVRPPARD
jgi:hypothetical protein